MFEEIKKIRFSLLLTSITLIFLFIGNNTFVEMVFVYVQAVIVIERRKTDPFYLFCCIFTMAIPVVEFSREGYKTRKVFSFKSTAVK